MYTISKHPLHRSLGSILPHFHTRHYESPVDKCPFKYATPLFLLLHPTHGLLVLGSRYAFGWIHLPPEGVCVVKWGFHLCSPLSLLLLAVMLCTEVPPPSPVFSEISLASREPDCCLLCIFSPQRCPHTKTKTGLEDWALSVFQLS